MPAARGVRRSKGIAPPPAGPHHVALLRDDTYARAAELGAVRRRFRELRPDLVAELRMIGYLRRVLGLSVPEVARVLGVTPRTALDYWKRWRALVRAGSGALPSGSGSAADRGGEYPASPSPLSSIPRRQGEPRG